MNILDFIRYGKENAITRKQLCSAVHADDRSVREMIEQSRREGNIIINDQDGKGYYQSNDVGDIERQYNQLRSRALSILAQQKPLRKVLKMEGRI